MSLLRATVLGMENYVFLAIGLAVGAGLGWLLGSRKRSTTSVDGTNFEVEAASAKASAEELRKRIESLEAEIKARDLKAEQENRVLEALAPVKQNLADMTQKVNQIEEQRKEQHTSLQEQIKNTLETARSLQGQTTALANAMKDNRLRGAWGEAQLENLVRNAGLIDKVDFTTQKVTSNASGENNIKPDMVIHLPGGQSIPVDSKVPFDAYIEASAITDLTNPAELARQKTLLEKHVSDLRGHIKKLGEKKYWEGYSDSPEFVIAFIPSESLLSAALDTDKSLLDFAFKSRVVLASPVNLFSLLKSIALIWQNTANQETLVELIKLGKELFERLTVVAKHADLVGKGIEATQKAYSDFVGSLERNLFTTARELAAKDTAQFGLVDIKDVRQIEGGVREFTKFDLTDEDPEVDGKEKH